MSHNPHTPTHQTHFLTVCNTYNTLPPHTHTHTHFPFRRHKPWCAAHLWPNPGASPVQSATYGGSNCLSAAWMSNQTRGVSARIFFPTFHVCSVLFLPPKSAKLDWYASSQEESCMPYLSDRPTVCKLLAPQDWGLVCGRYSGYYTTVDFACYGLHL